MNEPVAHYKFRETEQRWQRIWAERKSFELDPNSAKPPYYVLEMFPYPSGFIHMGHVRNYTLGDVTARYARAKGFEVLHPMGWDAFGLPAENAAIERGVQPKDWTYRNMDAMREQLAPMGLSYDWSRELATCDPDYYRHEQKFFLEFLKAGIAYRKESYVNWDPVDHTVLANEQVIDGRGWRSGAPVERKKLSQWFLRITDFAEDLLDGLKTLTGWPDKVRIMQERWIGKSTGAKLSFTVAGRADTTITVFTTRPDTLYGMSFCAISPQHPLAQALAMENAALAEFIAECDRTGTSEEAIETAEKKGFDTGLKVRHPFDPSRAHPVYIANFVLMEYGTGAVFGCPAHDERDFEFARKYNLPILPVVSGGEENPDCAYTGDGALIHSEFLNGLTVAEAKEAAIARLVELGVGEKTIQYRLRDWGVSRQRYWGCPIPIIYCDTCGTVPVPDEQLPVRLPDDVTFDKPGNPLDHHPTWKHVACPVCGRQATRETDTFDTFFESSWYFARFCSPKSALPFDRAMTDRFLPVDRYIGGVEHAVLHLLYARFFTRALTKIGYLNVEEPFKGLLTQGMVCMETCKDADGRWLYPEEVFTENGGKVDKDGRPVTVGRSEKMSKSKRNTVNPGAIIERHGADTARLFLLSDSPPERDLEWTDAGIDGAWRYIERLNRLVNGFRLLSLLENIQKPVEFCERANNLRKKTHKTIHEITRDIENFHFNKAVARLRELSNAIEVVATQELLYHSQHAHAREDIRYALREAREILIRLAAPFIPHFAEEAWRELGHTDTTLSNHPWPVADLALCVEDEITIAVQVNGKLRTTIACSKDATREEMEALALAEKNVQDSVKDKTIRKIIVVPGKIVNVVAA